MDSHLEAKASAAEINMNIIPDHSISSPDHEHDTVIDSEAIFRATQSNDTQLLEKFLDRIPDSDAIRSDGWTLLHCAAFYNAVEAIELLLKHGADINKANDGLGETALHLATRNGYIDAVRALLHYGFGIDLQTGHGYTALIIAVRRGYPLLVNLLLERGANTDIADEKGDTALIYAAKGGRQDIMDDLLHHKADVSKADLEGNTVLHFAARRGHVRTIASLLDHGSVIDIRNKHGSTALLLAAEHGYLEIVEMLVQRNANASIVDMDGDNALTVATENCHYDIVKILNHTAIIGPKNSKGKAALNSTFEENTMLQVVPVKNWKPTGASFEFNHGGSEDYSAACPPSQITAHHPTPVDILYVSSLLAKNGLSTKLIDLILEQAEYWARITTTLDISSGKDYTAYGKHREHVLILRSKPICSAAADGIFDETSTVQSSASAEPGLIRTPTDPVQNLDSSQNNIILTPSKEGAVPIPEPRDCHPVRRITWTIISHDQGWSDESGDTYNPSWTGFRGNVLRYVPLGMVLSGDAWPQHSDGSSGAEFWQFPSQEYLSAWDNTQALEKRLGRENLGQYTEGTTDELRVWAHGNDFFKKTKIQVNRRAVGEPMEHVIVWDARDCVTAEDPEAVYKLVRRGRGVETGSGKQVRALCRGDVVELHSFAFFPGWMNRVMWAQVVIEFAM